MKTKLIILTAALLLIAGGAVAFALVGLNKFEVADDGTRLPKVSSGKDGFYEVTIPEDPKPQKSYVQTLEAPKDTVTKRAKKGDLVGIHFQVVGWDTGETREASRKLTKNPIKVEAGLDTRSLQNGVRSKSPVIVPQFLHDALVGTAAGERKLVVFPENTPDLPTHLSQSDAYALVVDILEVH